MSIDYASREQYERCGSAMPILEDKDCPPLAPNTYECRVAICPEPEGGFSVHALKLPGIVSQGETLEESLANIADAFRAAIAVYTDIDASIPWEDVDVERTEGTIERWILVDA